MHEQLRVDLFNTDSYGLENLTVEIFDVNGKLVHSQIPESNSFVIGRGVMSAGLYLVTVRSGVKRIGVEKLVVQ